MATEKGYAIFINKDYLGHGDQELGKNLINMAIYAISQNENLPEYVLFMNGGVKLPTLGDQQMIDSLNAMAAKGVKILVCGTCLNFYGVADQLKAGEKSNMYDITGAMVNASKVITL